MLYVSPAVAEFLHLNKILKTFSLKMILEIAIINNGIEMAIKDKLMALVVFPAK